jgi:hypothetical protein
VAEAAHAEGQFNIIDLTSGWKIDMILRKSTPYSIEAFSRRVVMDLDGIEVNVASAEDTLISKLDWARLGQSQRQLNDSAVTIRIRWEELYRDYVLSWVRELRLEPQWAEACRIAGVEP